jgi:hypothetical protein
MHKYLFLTVTCNSMNLETLLSTFPQEVQDSPSMQATVLFFKALNEQLEATQKQLQITQENLTKSQERIKVLEDELAKYRKTPKAPKFRSNGMEPRNRTGKSKSESLPSTTTPPSAIQKEKVEIIVKVPNPPEGSRFKGHQSFSVQDLSIVVKDITYKLEVWQTPEGEILRAKLPQELDGQHFGPCLKAFVINVYAQGMTQPEIHTFLQGWGIEISSGQINNLLLNEAEAFAKVSEEILTAGLKNADYIRADDTGEKHEHKNGYCTHIGGKYFAYYKTTFSKSRENFLDILLQEKKGYRFNEAALWHLFQNGVEDDILNLFEDSLTKVYTSPRGVSRLLNSLGIAGKKVRQQCREASIVGFISQNILKKGQVFLSDRAGQFAVFNHAACWVHMERPLRKIITTSNEVENSLQQVREGIWNIYRKLKEPALSQEDKKNIHKLYDELIVMNTMSPEINAVIANFAKYKDEMLKVLDHPNLPLHNNDSERDIRGVAKRRNLSGSTKSDLGRKFRDGLQTIKQTCFRVGYNFIDYLQLWCHKKAPNLADLVQLRYCSPSA